jgi:hypothetical protein
VQDEFVDDPPVGCGEDLQAQDVDRLLTAARGERGHGAGSVVEQRAYLPHHR